MKRRLSSSDSGDAAAGDALLSPASEPLSVTSEQLSELVKSVLSRDVLSSLLSQAALSLAPKRFGNVGFGGNDESNVNAFLHQKLGKDNLSRRAGPRGTKLTYIESCKAIELANQAFGFNGWSCHILECKEEYRQQKNERWSIGFSSLVRIELKDGSSHEDVGFGQADGQPHLGAAIEQAKKASISDARKRALRLFGEYLGNSCYDREHIKDVHSNKPTHQPVAIPAPGGQSLAPSAVPPVGTFGGPSPGSGNAAPFVNLPLQVPAQQVQQHQQQRQQQPAVATPSPPQPNGASVASRISALQAAESSRQASTMSSGVCASNSGGAEAHHDATRRAPPMPQLAHAQPASSAMGANSAARPTHTNAPPSAAPPHHAHPSMPQPSTPMQPRASNLPPQPFMPRNAPPPSRMLTEYPVVKNEPPRAAVTHNSSIAASSEFDMNDLSLSQFDYDPSDFGGPPNGAKRMRP